MTNNRAAQSKVFFSQGNIVYRQNICCFVSNTEPLFLIVPHQNSWYEFTLHGCINTSADRHGQGKKIASHSVRLIFSLSQHSSLRYSSLMLPELQNIHLCISLSIELHWTQVIQRGAREGMAWAEAQVGGWGVNDWLNFILLALPWHSSYRQPASAVVLSW